MTIRMCSVSAAVVVFWAIVVPAGASLAQTPPPVSPDGAEGDPLAAFSWETGGTGKLGARAEIAIPPGYRFLQKSEASKLIEALGNISSKQELGLLASQNLEWFVVFFFDDVGYVKDDEKDELNAEEMAKDSRASLQQSNEVRRERGIPELHFDGWAIEPRYNDESKQLEWATRLRSKGGVSVNYNTRVLGRKGVMRVILVTDPESLQAVLPEYRMVMDGFRYIDGERYAQYVQGDKIAKYGLIALVAGGATAVAAKTGVLAGLILFFKKGFKFIIIGLAAVGAWVARLFKRSND